MYKMINRWSSSKSDHQFGDKSLQSLFLNKFKLTSKVAKRTLEQNKVPSLIKTKIYITIQNNITFNWDKIKVL